MVRCPVLSCCSAAETTQLAQDKLFDDPAAWAPQSSRRRDKLSIDIPCKHPDRGPMLYEARPGAKSRDSNSRAPCCHLAPFRGLQPGCYVRLCAERLGTASVGSHRRTRHFSFLTPHSSLQVLEYCAEATRQARACLSIHTSRL